MAGIVFLRTVEFERIVSFYLDRIGMSIWLEQPDIAILRHGNLLIGWQKQASADTGALLTFFYRTREEVDAMYQALNDIATTVPQVNERYRIYNFFAVDPEGRRIEFQQFLHVLPEVEWR